jgi:hypothetical protein
MQLRSLLFWNVTQSRWVVSYQFLGQSIGPIFKGLTGCAKTMITTNLCCITSQKSDDLIYIAAGA